MRRIVHTVLAIAASLLVAGAHTVHAQTDLLAGKRLLLRRSAKGERLIVVSRDRLMAPIPGGPDDPTLRGAVLDLGNPSTGEWVSFAIPAAGWTLNALGTVFRYHGGGRAVGALRTLVIRHQKRLKIRGTAIGLGLDEPAQGGLAVVLTTGSHRYCLLFDGGAVKRDAPGRFAARNAAAPAACPAPRLVSSTTSSTFLPRPGSTTTSTTRATQPLPASTSTSTSSSSSSTRASSTVTTSTTTSSTSTTSGPPTTSTTSTITTTSSTIATTTTSTSSSTTSTSTSSTTSTTGFTCGGFHVICGGTCPPGTACVGGLIVECSCQAP